MRFNCPGRLASFVWSVSVVVDSGVVWVCGERAEPTHHQWKTTDACDPLAGSPPTPLVPELQSLHTLLSCVCALDSGIKFKKKS